MNELEEKGTAASSGKATASLILGGVSIPGALGLGILILPCALIGLVLGFMSMKSDKKGVAKAGVIVSVIAVVLSILVTIALALMNANMEQHHEQNPFGELFNQFTLDGKTLEQLILEAETTEQLILESELEQVSEESEQTEDR